MKINRQSDASPTDNSKYIPGVCNIGPAERVKRRRGGIVSLIVAIVLLTLLLAVGASKWWRLLLILPVAGAASGFFQYYFHFCAGFGMKGLYNVINSVGNTEDITNEEFRVKDRRKTQMILGLSLITGTLVGLISILIT